jgi:hypothetical protein
MTFGPTTTATKSSSSKQTFHIIDAFFGSLMFRPLVIRSVRKCSTYSGGKENPRERAGSRVGQAKQRVVTHKDKTH